MVDIQPNHEITRFFLIDKNHKALGKFYVKFYGFYLLEETWTVIISMKGTTKFAATQWEKKVGTTMFANLLRGGWKLAKTT